MCFDCLLLKISQGIINYLILLFPVQKIGGCSYIWHFLWLHYSQMKYWMSPYVCFLIIMLKLMLYCDIDSFALCLILSCERHHKSYKYDLSHRKVAILVQIPLKVACKIILWIELVNWVHKFISASNNVYPDANIHVNNLQ